MPKFWTKLIMQGRGDSDQWVTSIKIKSSLNGIIWQDVDGGKTYPANYNRNEKVNITFDEPVYARVIRIFPQAWDNFMSLRF
jgi:hypothetical protein